MQQPQSQRGRLVSAFQNDFSTQNQKRAGNGPSTQYPRGGGPKKRTIRKKPYNNSTGEKNTDISSSVKGKGPRQKFYPNKTVVFNRKKNFNEANTENNIEEIGFSFKNAQPVEINNDNEINSSSSIVDLTQNNIVDKESREQRFNSNPFGNQYLIMKKQREQLRKNYIKKGLIDDPDKPRRLEDAIPFVGECQDMCPEFERYEREYQKNLDKLEINQELSSDEIFYVDHVRAVKRYQRSDAGKEQPLPCDVRPPPILRKTLNYLIDEIIMKHGIESSHGFVRDRTRSIRQDFSLQNIRDKSAVDAHERIARYHILCLHQLCEKEGFSVQQEKEQLFKVLQSLQEFYDEGHEKNIKYPNEAEFRAYYIISHLFDNDIVRKAELYSKEVFFHPLVQLALDFQSLTDVGKSPGGSLSLYTRIFKKIFSPETPYLMGCLMEIHFNTIRKNALIAMNYAVKFRDNILPPYPAEKLKDILGFDTIENLLDVLNYYSIEIDSQDNYYGVIFDKKKGIIEPEVSLSQKRTEKLERKRENVSDRDIINGGKSDKYIDEPQSMFSFSQPNIINTSINNNMFSNNINNNNNIVRFSFNNKINNISDNGMNDINMDPNDTSYQEMSMFSDNNNSNVSVFNANNKTLLPKSNLEFNKPQSAQSNKISFSFKQPPGDNNINLSEPPKPTFSFQTSAEKSGILPNNKPTTNLTIPNIDTKSSINTEPNFTFDINKNSKTTNESKTPLFNINTTTNEEKSKIEETKAPTFTFDSNKLRSSNSVTFSIPNTKKENEDKKSIFTFGSINRPTDIKTDVNKENKNSITINIIPPEESDSNDPLKKKQIKEKTQIQFMENNLKRKTLQNNSLLRTHNIGIRPKPPLDELIIKTMQKRKEVEEESKYLYNDLIKNTTKNLIQKTIQEEIIIQSIYSEIISTLTREIIREEMKENKKDETLLNNYHQALELSTKDILNEVVIKEFQEILKSEYDILLEEQKIKNLKLKRAQLKKQRVFFNERLKYQRLKHIFSKWNHIVKLKINERRIEEEKLKMKKLEFDNTIKLMEIGPGLNNPIKKNKEFIFKNKQNINNINDINENNGINGYYIDYDYEEENDQKIIALNNSQININDITTNYVKKQYLDHIDDSVFYLKIMISLPNDSNNTTLWTNSQFKIGSMENNIINLSQENENYYYNIDDYIQFSQNKLRDEKKLSIIIQNIPYIENNEMEWNEESSREEDNSTINENIKEYYASAALFQLSIYSFQQNSYPEEIAQYWDNERNRLDLFLRKIQNYSNIPLIILYWKSPNINTKQFIQDARYYLRLGQFYNEQQVQNYQFLSMPYTTKGMIPTTSNALTTTMTTTTINPGNDYNSNRIEKLNIGMTWLIENCHLYTLSSNVMNEIVQNNFYAMFLAIILKHIENEIPYGVVAVENILWFRDTCNIIIESYNYILTAIIEFLYSSQVQYVHVIRKEGQPSSSLVVEYEDSEGYVSTSAAGSGTIEMHHWLMVFETLKEKVNEVRLPELKSKYSSLHSHHPQTLTEESLYEIFDHYVQSIDYFKSLQKTMISKEIKRILRDYLKDSENHKFPYHSIFNVILQHALNSLREILNDYEIYFIKYNVTRCTEEIRFFEYLLEKYKNSLYDLLNQWANETLTRIEQVYFNNQNKRTRNSIEETWHEISKKYQRTENSKIVRNPIIRSQEKTVKKTTATKPKDIKVEQKLLKDLISRVKKEFPFLK